MVEVVVSVCEVYEVFTFGPLIEPSLDGEATVPNEAEFVPVDFRRTARPYHGALGGDLTDTPQENWLVIVRDPDETFLGITPRCLQAFEDVVVAVCSYKLGCVTSSEILCKVREVLILNLPHSVGHVVLRFLGR